MEHFKTKMKNIVLLELMLYCVNIDKRKFEEKNIDKKKLSQLLNAYLWYFENDIVLSITKKKNNENKNKL